MIDKLEEYLMLIDCKVSFAVIEFKNICTYILILFTIEFHIMIDIPTTVTDRSAFLSPTWPTARWPSYSTRKIYKLHKTRRNFIGVAVAGSLSFVRSPSLSLSLWGNWHSCLLVVNNTMGQWTNPRTQAHILTERERPTAAVTLSSAQPLSLILSSLLCSPSLILFCCCCCCCAWQLSLETVESRQYSRAIWAVDSCKPLRITRRPLTRQTVPTVGPFHPLVAAPCSIPNVRVTFFFYYIQHHLLRGE